MPKIKNHFFAAKFLEANPEGIVTRIVLFPSNSTSSVELSMLPLISLYPSQAGGKLGATVGNPLLYPTRIQLSEERL